MVSIKEVAKHAGVAISTVSKVLNGYPNVSEETKKKVQDAIKELNYIPNSIAAAFSSKQFGRIALVLDPNRQTQAIDQIFMQYLVGALDKAKEQTTTSLFFAYFSATFLAVSSLKSPCLTIIDGICR